jgi:alkanesulfonate monooxygenase SsuD/methylene tetrahydromethanopterin reductase-like flavin-dependent oxidoreductase (luciferase family)
MAYVAGITERVRIVITVLVPAPRHPVVLAKQLSTIDHLAKGRAIVALASGELDREREYFGMPFAERGQLLDHYINAMLMLWTEPRASYSCKYFSFHDVELYPRPYTKPHLPLWIGGGAYPPVIRRCARVGDGWAPPGSRLAPPDLKKGIAKIRAEAAAIGRDIAHFEPTTSAFTLVAPSDSEARAMAAPFLASRYATPHAVSRRWVEPAAPLEDAMTNFALVGSPERVIERIHERLDAGVKSIRLDFPPLGLEHRLRMITYFADAVIPNI